MNENIETNDDLVRLVEAIKQTPADKLEIKTRTLQDIYKTTGVEEVNCGGYPTLVDVHPKFSSFRAKYNEHTIYVGFYKGKYRVYIDNPQGKEIFVKDYPKDSHANKLFDIFQSKIKEARQISESKLIDEVLVERK